MARRYDSKEAKRRILTACVRLFLEKGYTNTKVAEIFKGSRCFCRVVPEYFPHKRRRADRADRHDVRQAVRRGKAAGGKCPPRRCTSTRWKRLCSWR